MESTILMLMMAWIGLGIMKTVVFGIIAIGVVFFFVNKKIFKAISYVLRDTDEL